MSEGADHTLSSWARQLTAGALIMLVATAAQAAAPKAVLFIIVDQFVPQYLDASYPYTGGLKKLRDESAWFTDAHYEQIPTVTAVGHTTLLTGAPPGKTGIIGNDWYDRKRGEEVESSEFTALVPTLGDALKEKNVRSRVLVLSGKRRSTAAMAGKRADLKAAYFLRSDPTVAEKAKQAIVDLGVGEDDIPDLVVIGFSATDGIGHRNGPHSEEMRENLLRLDGVLSDLLNFCDKRFGPDGYALVLTSDHGVLPMPESEAGKRIKATRLDRKRLIGEIEAALRKEFPHAPEPLVKVSLPNIYLSDALKNSLEAARSAVQTVSGIAAVYAPPFNANDPFTPYYRRSHFPGRSGDLLVRLEEGALTVRTGTSHSSPYPYDTHVPVLFWGAGIKPGRYSRRISALDVAPTLAAILELPKFSEGAALPEVLRK